MKPVTQTEKLQAAVIYAKSRCKSSASSKENSGRNCPVTITPQDIMDLWVAQDGRCAETGQKMSLSYKVDYVALDGPKATTLSVDRIDNSKGYVPGNVRLTTRITNMIRNDSPIEDNKTKEYLDLVVESEDYRPGLLRRIWKAIW